MTLLWYDLAVAGLRPSRLPRTRNGAILVESDPKIEPERGASQARARIPGFGSNVLTVGMKRL